MRSTDSLAEVQRVTSSFRWYARVIQANFFKIDEMIWVGGMQSCWHLTLMKCCFAILKHMAELLEATDAKESLDSIMD